MRRLHFPPRPVSGTGHCAQHWRGARTRGVGEGKRSLSGYGDADMINCYNENGEFIIPPAKNNTLVGEQLSLQAKLVNAKYVIPFSSHHQYQRSDSIWAKEYVTPIHSYEKGLHKKINFIPPFVEIDCQNGDYKEIRPSKLSPKIYPPEAFGDDWSDELTLEDKKSINKYPWKNKVKISSFDLHNHYKIKNNLCRIC